MPPFPGNPGNPRVNSWKLYLVVFYNDCCIFSRKMNAACEKIQYMPQGIPRQAKGTSKDGQREPRAPQRETKGAKGIPKGDKGSPRAPNKGTPKGDKRSQRHPSCPQGIPQVLRDGRVEAKAIRKRENPRKLYLAVFYNDFGTFSLKMDVISEKMQ